MTADKHARRRSVGSQAVSLAVATGVAQVLVAIFYAASARSSNPQDFGVVAAAVSLGIALVGFIDFGTNALWTRELASERLDLHEHKRRLTSKLILATSLLAVAAAASVLLASNSRVWVKDDESEHAT